MSGVMVEKLTEAMAVENLERATEGWVVMHVALAMLESGVVDVGEGRQRE